MKLEHKPPAGPRPANYSPTRLSRIPDSGRLPSSSTSSNPGVRPTAPMLSAPASRNHSLFSLGPKVEQGQLGEPTGSYDFLPSVNFDDLHSSLESDFKLTQFPSPTGQGSILETQGLLDRKMPDHANAAQNGSVTRAAVAPASGRPGRTGSILRRPSLSSRQSSASSTMLTSAGPNDNMNGSAAVRSRRQSHYPPVSNTQVTKPPARKSVGPGMIGEVDSGTRNAQRRRPSVRGDRSTGDTTRMSMDSSSATGSDNTRNMTNTRTSKARSVLPPARANAALGDTLTPEHNRLSTLAPRSPHGGGRGTNPSSAGKRTSMMPGSHHSSHATGLGARTISPTDARRMKRMSLMPQSQSLNQIISVPPPPPLSFANRAESRSPSMIPRKTSVTPSSARTTPDVNRKSYSSGLSVGSTTSFNTVRTSTGSLQPRLAPSMSASRLPAPKNTNGPHLASAEEEEFVPPVPAIPKAYESPKESPAADNYFMAKRKPGLAAPEALRMHNPFAGDVSLPDFREPTKVQRRPSARKSSYVPSTRANGNKTETNMHVRKQLLPLSLPPLNIGPLNIPTTIKATAPYNLGRADRDLSPPPSRQLPKTPTTPLTASRSSFFSKSRHDDTMEMPSLRSSTSAHHMRRLTPTPPDGSSSESSMALKEPHHKPSMSPFLSSSAPKGGFDYSYFQRPRTGGDDAALEHRALKKSSGPREPDHDRSVAKSPEHEILEQPQTPSSISSLRRKLSLSWKRNNSKGSMSGLTDAMDNGAPQHQTRMDNMPPPRIPISATVNNLSSMKQPSPSPRPALKSTSSYLESRRRKSSAASLTKVASHDQSSSDVWGGKKDANEGSRNPSVMNRILKPKSSSSAMRGLESSAAELDKDDLAAEEEMRKMGHRRKETETAAKTLDTLKKRATAKERVGPHEAIRIAMLNIYERGEIVDYSDIYFCGTQNAHKVVGDLQSDSPNFGYDDERGDYTIVAGDHLAYRYEIIDILGKGSFGQVVRCIDHKLGVLVALKIIRNKKRFHQQALVEVNILQKLREWDPKNRHSMVNFTQSFYFRCHLCISTELLDLNLYEFIKAHTFRGFSIRIVRRFAKQILSSLILLKQHKVIHCDLKPENILLRHPMHSEIKVIDFGSSCFENEKVYTYIQSRFYRSPEVILGMTYGMPIDMWSLGCILAELYTGVPLFPGENEQEQLSCIMEVFGPPEKHLIEKSTRKKLFFDSMGKPRLTISSKGRRRRPSSKTLQQALKCDDEVFVDFLARCLRWDPDRRMRPEDAIRHEFITGKKPAALPVRDPSPVRRQHPTLAARPLPDPPSSYKAPPLSTRTGASPHKPASGGQRRASGPMAPTAASVNKRASVGVGVAAGMSNLPRAAGRTASGKLDLAAAGASAAMNRRA